MKKLILSACAALLLPLSAAAGDVTAGSVPGSLNYQGRLERDNAPITGPIHLYFRIYNSATANNTAGGSCGGVSQPCLWQSPEITVQATQGIFSADITPPVSVLAGGAKLYIEVQVESDVLSPREPLNSVAYSMLAKKLEDGASVSVTTLTALNDVYLSTAAGAQAAIGTLTADPGMRLTVSGSLKIVGGSLVFPDNTSMNTANVGSASNISNVTDADVLADGNSDGAGDVILRKPTLNFLRITNSGRVGVGSAFTSDGGANPPNGLLDVDGALYVGNEGVYDRDDSELNVKQDLLVEGGKVTGMNAENISLGETNDIISFSFGAAEKMRIHTNSYVGIGMSAPTAMLQVAGDIRANSGVRGGVVSVGGYGGDWTGSVNEVRAQNNSHLLLQQTNSYNVGIGTDTPREKLHVRGSIRSDYGVMASTASFGSDVRVNGTFTANSGAGNTVNLSSTVIYGTLQVTGGIGSLQGVPAYIGSTQTFTGQNSFQNQVVVSSDILTLNRVGAGVSDFDFAGTKYLQVGDNKPAFANDNALAYLVGGSNADAKLNFYRGATEIGRVETQTGASGAGLAQVVGGQTKVFTDSVYHHIQNSAVWISTAYNTTPAIYVSSWMGNVGMGTSVMDPNWKLTVNGNLRLSGGGSALIFSDGTSLNTASALGSATNLSANGDAVVQSNADLTGGGDVILRAGALDGLVLNSGGNIGIGTMFPQSKLNVRGDVMVGNTFNPYSGDSSEDLVVGGNIAFDGAMVQRSVLPVYLSKLVVASDVHLSTTAGTRTGIGNVAPGYTLDVTGDINAANSIYTGGTARISNTGTVGSGGANATWDGNTINVNRGGTGAATFTDGGILFGNGTGAIGATAVLANGQLLIGDGTQEPTVATLTGTANQVNVTNGAGSITLSLPQSIHTAADPTFNSLTLATDLSVANGGTGAGTFTDGGILFGNGTAALGATAVLANGELLIGDGTQEPTVATLTGTANQVNVTNGAGSITLSLPQSIHTGAAPQFAGVVASYARPAADAVTGFQVRTAGGTNVLNVDTTNQRVGVGNAAPTTPLDVTGKTRTTTFQMTNGAVNNYVLTSDASGNASWNDPASGTFGDGWVGNEIEDVANATLVRSGLGTNGNRYKVALNLNNANTWTANQIFTSSIAAVLTDTIGSNDYYRIMGSATGSNAGFLEIATADDGTEPIYVRQYTGVFATLTRTATLLDGSGNTSFPGTVSATTFSGALSGNASSASQLSPGNTINGTSFDGSAAVSIPVNTANDTTTNATMYPLWTTGINGNYQPKTTSTKLTFNPNSGVLTATGFSGPLTGNVTGNVTGNAGGTAANVTGTVAVGNGGTGATSLTSNGVLYGNGAGTVQATAAGGANTVLRGTGGAPSFGTIDSNYTSGTSTSFEVYSSTGMTGTCRTLTITNGMVTGITGSHACP